MVTQNIKIEMKEKSCDTFIAYPGDQKQYPAVLFYMDAFGLRPYLYSMAEKLAAQGYYVVLPNLFYRIGSPPVLDVKFPVTLEALPEARAKMMSLFQKFSFQDAVGDAGIFLKWISHQKQVKPGKIGVTGYCMGGNLALRTAAQYPDSIAAAASFHGASLAPDAPDSPHRLMKQVQAELYIANADQDPFMPPEQIERLRSALNENQIRYEMETYPGAIHGFTMADLPALNEEALNQHWKKLNALFSRCLG